VCESCAWLSLSVFRLGKFTHGLTHSAGEFRQFLGAEKEQHDDQDHDPVRTGQIG
jgi:hypothetical protein